MTDSVQKEFSELEKKYFNAAASWDEDQRAQDRLAVKRYKAVAIGSVVIAALMGASVMTLIPLKQIVPAVIRVDNATGAFDVKVGGEDLDIGDRRNEKIVITDVTRYIKAREGFTRGEAEENYKMAYLMSCNGQRAEWDNYMNPTLNKNSPVNVLTNQDADRVDVEGVTFLQSLDEDSKVAQVQFYKTAIRGNMQPLKYRFVATLSVRYDPKNIPGKQMNYYLNPFGFCVDSYRRDPVGNPIAVNPPGTPDQELNQQMEAYRQEGDAAMQALRDQINLRNAQIEAAKQAVNQGLGVPPTVPQQSQSSPTNLSNIGLGNVPVLPKQDATNSTNAGQK